MHRDMFKIQDGVAIVEKLNCKQNTKVNEAITWLCELNNMSLKYIKKHP